jgi:nucleoside-triphosphatase THEP1
MLPTILRGLLWFIKNLESFLVIIVASVCATLHLLHIIDEHTVAAVTLATLALLGFSMLHDRVSRGTLQKSVTDLDTSITLLSNRIDEPLAETFYKHETSERPLLAEAELEIWAVQETGSVFGHEYKGELVTLLKEGRSVRLVVTSPDESTARLVSLRNAGLNPANICGRAGDFQGHIREILEGTGQDAERLEIRYIPYPVDMTCIIADPAHHLPGKRKGVVRHAGFQVPFRQKLAFSLSASGSPNIFSHYFNEVMRVFDHASKVVLLTGPPRSGKTKMMERIIASINDPADLFFAISPSLGDRNKRLGFAVKVSDTQEAVTFAKRKENEPGYEIDRTVWPKITARLSDAWKKNQIIVLDEIGPIELEHQEFEDLIRAVVGDVTATLFATVAEDDARHPILSWLKHHHRTTVLHINSENIDQIESRLLRELKASLRKARDLHRPIQ